LSQFENRYSFADREWDYVVKCCERNGIAFIPWFSTGSRDGRRHGAGEHRQKTAKQMALA
jgi:pyridoxine 4-dehydrogenase